MEANGGLKEGKRHREDTDENGFTLPAEICADGRKSWYKNGKLHREDTDENGFTLPAVILDNGTKFWY